jgi:arylamine N-acetyltransferase
MNYDDRSSRATPDGRVTLREIRLIITRNGERQERALKTAEEYAAVLREYFDGALND